MLRDPGDVDGWGRPPDVAADQGFNPSNAANEDPEGFCKNNAFNGYCEWNVAAGPYSALKGAVPITQTFSPSFFIKWGEGLM